MKNIFFIIALNDICWFEPYSFVLQCICLCCNTNNYICQYVLAVYLFKCHCKNSPGRGGHNNNNKESCDELHMAKCLNYNFKIRKKTYTLLLISTSVPQCKFICPLLPMSETKCLHGEKALH